MLNKLNFGPPTPKSGMWHLRWLTNASHNRQKEADGAQVASPGLW